MGIFLPAAAARCQLTALQGVLQWEKKSAPFLGAFEERVLLPFGRSPVKFTFHRNRGYLTHLAEKALKASLEILQNS